MWYFNSKGLEGKEKRVLTAQFNELDMMRRSVEQTQFAPVTSLLANTINYDLRGNAALTPADAYREMDAISKEEMNVYGEFGTLDKVLGVNKSVNIGRQVYNYRQISSMDQNGSTSMSGNQGIALDHTGAKYEGAIVPIHDQGYGRNFRELEAMRADGYDALVDDARESRLALMRRVNSCLWNGAKDKQGQFIVVDGKQWKGLKGDSSVVQTTYTGSLLTGTGAEIRDIIRGLRDQLTITNNCAKGLKLAISQGVASSWEREYSAADGTFGTIKDWIARLDNIDEIYVDGTLIGEECAINYVALDGLHSITGMAMGSFALPRNLYNSDYNFMMAMATGFMARQSYAGKKCALYATKAS